MVGVFVCVFQNHLTPEGLDDVTGSVRLTRIHTRRDNITDSELSSSITFPSCCIFSFSLFCSVRLSLFVITFRLFLFTLHYHPLTPFFLYSFLYFSFSFTSSSSSVKHSWVLEVERWVCLHLNVTGHTYLVQVYTYVSRCIIKTFYISALVSGV